MDKRERMTMRGVTWRSDFDFFTAEGLWAGIVGARCDDGAFNYCLLLVMLYFCPSGSSGWVIGANITFPGCVSPVHHAQLDLFAIPERVCQFSFFFSFASGQD
jgi:hypothetical protein